MNKQRKVLITVTYNEMGIIIDTKVEEVAQPDVTDTNVGDTIYRQAAIDAVINSMLTAAVLMGESPKGSVEIHEAIKNLKDLPSAQPERMRGRWQEITEGDCSGYDPVLAGYDDPVVGYICSVCHEGYEKEVMGKTTWDFCPNCGADMRGGEDE